MSGETVWNLAQVEIWLAAAIGGGAVVEDLWRRTISNWWALAALAGGLVCQVAAYGVQGVLWWVLGAVSGFLVFLVFYFLGGMGGGDVKLMAGFGAMLGAQRLLWAAFWTALIGGVLAAIVLLLSLARYAWSRSAPGGERKKLAASIPYAPAIAAGVLMTLLSKP